MLLRHESGIRETAFPRGRRRRDAFQPAYIGRAGSHDHSGNRIEGERSMPLMDVAAYLNRLPAPAAAKTGNGASVALGRGIFHEQCASCHRADAAGDKEGFVPSLRNQNYQYLVGQLHRMAESHRHNVDRNLMLLIRSLDDADIVAVADYLSRRRGVVRAHDHMLGNGVVVN
jgi:cytochrome c553